MCDLFKETQNLTIEKISLADEKWTFIIKMWTKEFKLSTILLQL